MKTYYKALGCTIIRVEAEKRPRTGGEVKCFDTREEAEKYVTSWLEARVALLDERISAMLDQKKHYEQLLKERANE